MKKPLTWLNTCTAVFYFLYHLKTQPASTHSIELIQFLVNFTMDQIPESCVSQLESDYVRKTYDKIANKFSATRHKKWPKVDKFISNLKTGSLLLDVGCGNGKYLNYTHTMNIGCDMSRNLLLVCKERGFEVVQCDFMRLPFREERFQALICIASLHHITTEKRRQLCLEVLINRMLANEATALIYVWSFEQNIDKHNHYLRPNQEYCESQSMEKLLLNEFELPIHKNRTPFKAQDVLVPFNITKTCKSDSEQKETQEVFLRYYHVYKEKELDKQIESILNCQLIDSYHDSGNWCCIVQKKK